MKKDHKIKILNKVIATILFIGFLVQTSAIQAQSVRSRLKITYEKNSDGTKELNAKLLLRQGRRYIPAPDFEIEFTATNNKEVTRFGTGTTNTDGEAMMIISSEYKVPVNEENYSTFTATFAGNDTCRSSTSDVEVKDISINVEVSDIESKTVMVTLLEKDSTGNQIPVADEFLSISIERLYSLLPIGDGMTDENGIFEFTYEDEIPGDAEGNINLVIRLEESELYGTVEAESKAKWGTPVSNEVDVSARALWSDQAPLWMLIAVFIVLIGAWFNFGLAIYNLLKIKKVK
ncbi:MAG: hypothetical protein R3182_12425 [Draconibacterium sp.]|nr:hypothetical protein [Draconibacterium sp.]